MINGLHVSRALELGITKDQLQNAFNLPDRKEQISDTATLLYKKLPHRLRSKSDFIFCTNFAKGHHYFNFGYIIPSDIYRSDISLIEIIKVFSNQFGCMVKVDQDQLLGTS